MTEDSMYKLDPITDNPKYEGFAFVREESVRGIVIGGQSRLVWDFGPTDLKTQGCAWTVPPLAPYWSPQRVIGRVRAFNDFPSVNLIIPAFSRRAVDVLREFLEPNGELLPLVSTVGEYYAYNITTVADVLDQEKSEFQWIGEKRTFNDILDINHYEFIADKVTGLSIFRLVERCANTYVSQMFVDRVKQHGLQGFHFTKLWPLPKEQNWQADADREWKEELEVQTSKGRKSAIGNTVVILLTIVGKKPNKAEKARVAKLMDEIDSLLYSPDARADAPLLGSLEGDDHVEGEIRLFLSCPDADALVAKLRPFLQTLSWKGEVKVLKRYGEYVATNCREEYVDL
ncbi:MAG: hypothetical protein L0Y72_24710 [Gemmataceae bacterium]|nr:hypothetical protein [Gemmataceae bacterium]